MALISRSRQTLAACLFTTCVLSGQQPAGAEAPRFEVVSIRPVPPDAPPLHRSPGDTSILPGGQYRDPQVSLTSMIAFAYDIKMPHVYLSGLPDWAKEQTYAVTAKPAEGFPALSPVENREQVRLMMCAMLVERFRLKLHSEPRKGQVFQLAVAKGGIKIPEVAPPVPPAKEGFVGLALSDRGGRIVGSKSTMAGLTRALEVFLRKPVIDRTGLTGYYDIDERWTALPSADPQGRGELGAEGIGLLISTVQERLGLRITNVPGEVTHWVVDHIEPPTEN